MIRSSRGVNGGPGLRVFSISSPNVLGEYDQLLFRVN
jgi:hypothetical protein